MSGDGRPALGEPAAGVVVSSFAVFEPGMLAAVYEQGRASCSRSDLVAARTETTIESLHDVLDGADVAHVAERLVGRRGRNESDRKMIRGLCSDVEARRVGGAEPRSAGSSPMVVRRPG